MALKISTSETLELMEKWLKEYEASGNIYGFTYQKRLISRIEHEKAIALQQHLPEPDIMVQLQQWFEEEQKIYNTSASGHVQEIITRLSEYKAEAHKVERAEEDPFPTRIPKTDIQAFVRAMAEKEEAPPVGYEDTQEESLTEIYAEDPNPGPSRNVSPTEALDPDAQTHGKPSHVEDEDPFSSRVPETNMKDLAQALGRETDNRIAPSEATIQKQTWNQPAENCPDAATGAKSAMVAPSLTPAQKATTTTRAQEAFAPGSGSAALFGGFLSNICHAVKSLFRPAPKTFASPQDAIAACSPMSEDVFSQKTKQLLQTWNFRRAHFEQAWQAVQENQFALEMCIGRIRENPLILRAMEEIRAAGGNDVEEHQVRKELAKSMGDKFSEYAGALRHDVAELTQNMEQFKKNARIAVEASGKEPLDRFACPEALEKNFKAFFQDVLDKQELHLIADKQGESLYEKADKLVQHIKEGFMALKKTFMGLLPLDTGEEGPAQRKRPANLSFS